MTNFEKLYEEKCLEFTQLKEELDDYQETSSILEKEMESQIKSLEKQLAEAKNKIVILSDDLAKRQEQASSKIKQLERELDMNKSQNEQNQQALISKQRQLVDFEIEIEQNKIIRREKDALVEDLEQKVDGTLEQLAIVQTELENRRNDSQDQIERLKQQLRDNQDELFATKQKTQVEMDRITKSSNQSPKLGPDRKRSLKNSSNNKHLVDTIKLGDILVAQVSPTEPKSLTQIDITQSNENQLFTRSQQSCSPDNGKIMLDSHFQNCSQNIQQLKVNTVGFSKSLNLISALIKDLDEKMVKIRSQKKQ